MLAVFAEPRYQLTSMADGADEILLPELPAAATVIRSAEEDDMVVYELEPTTAEILIGRRGLK